jgi:carbon storage regulator
MLVLTRKIGQSITIGDDVRLTIIDIDNAQIKVGIEAPQEVEIYREELYKKIKQKPFQAKSSKPS